VGALMVVSAVGDVRDPESGRLIAGARDAPDGRRLVDTAAALAAGAQLGGFAPVNTTIGCVVTSAALTKAEAARVAALGIDGFARALSPPHLPSDGDALFCLSVGNQRADVESVGALAATVVARAIVRAVETATPLPGLPTARSLGSTRNIGVRS
jgi:L-aminopeptidase/D-esterase-like protein